MAVLASGAALLQATCGGPFQVDPDIPFNALTQFLTETAIFFASNLYISSL